MSVVPKSISIFLFVYILFTVACISKKTIEAAQSNQRSSQLGNHLLSELIIQFNEATDVDTWLIPYKKYGIQLEKTISNTANIYLFSFDTNTVNKEQALKLFDRDKQVKAVELNKKIQQR